jgi:hypothetical protein
MAFIQIGGLRGQDYVQIGTITCSKCSREFRIYFTDGEVVPNDALEKARQRIEETCGNHAGNDSLGPF